jgi:hypothetical protein
MQSNQFEHAVASILEKENRFQPGAYFLAREALDFTVDRLSRETNGEKRHVSGRELLQGFRDYVIQEYGPMLAKSSSSSLKTASLEDKTQTRSTTSKSSSPLRKLSPLLFSSKHSLKGTLVLPVSQQLRQLRPRCLGIMKGLPVMEVKIIPRILQLRRHLLVRQWPVSKLVIEVIFTVE